MMSDNCVTKRRRTGMSSDVKIKISKLEEEKDEEV